MLAHHIKQISIINTTIIKIHLHSLELLLSSMNLLIESNIQESITNNAIIFISSRLSKSADNPVHKLLDN